MPGKPAALDLGTLREMPRDARLWLFETYLCRDLAKWLDVPPAHRISRTRPLYTQGMDSLTALALQRRLESALRIPVPAHHLLREQSVGELAATLSALVDRSLTPEQADAPPRRRRRVTI
ncbi:acyl carrier protein [Streptomyces sp. NPDC048389]|uniref:acyl carrier protein n=1 Tax=Streptomyces sp. NPDC048389 TaxID=3154622 RepID=UPI003456051A